MDLLDGNYLRLGMLFPVISYNIACEIADNYCPEALDNILVDCNKDMLECIKDSNALESIEDFEMSDDFPKLQTKLLF